MVDKIIDPGLAAKAYANNTTIRGSAGEDQLGADKNGVTFADFLRQKAEDSIGALRQSEAVSAQAVTGEADITDVVQAVTNAELTLQTVVSIRDRMVSAYQEIMRMPI